MSTITKAMTNLADSVRAVADHEGKLSCPEMLEVLSSLQDLDRVKIFLDGSIRIVYVGSIDKIRDHAFRSCDYLKYVYLEDTVVYLGRYAFCDCVLLEYINLSDIIQHIGDAAFLGCISLQFIHWPAGITTIGTSMFEGCSSLEEIELPATLLHIGDKAFKL